MPELTLPPTFDTGYLLGLMAGDGSINKHAALYLCKAEQKVVDEFIRICQPFTHNQLRSYENVHTFDGCDCVSWSHRLYCPPLAKYVEDSIGLGAYNKRVPVANGSSDFSKGILSGIWDSDGAVTVNMNRKKPQYQLSLTSRSKTLVETVGTHLEHFKLPFSIYTYERKGALYLLNVLGIGMPTLATLLDIKTPRKVERLELIKEITFNHSYTKRNTKPESIVG